MGDALSLRCNSSASGFRILNDEITAFPSRKSALIKALELVFYFNTRRPYLKASVSSAAGS